MSINTAIKTIQNIMRKDAGVDGDAQRISQITWLLFLKIYDAKEEEIELLLDEEDTDLIHTFSGKTEGPILFGRLNLIVVTTQEEYESWHEAMDTCWDEARNNGSANISIPRPRAIEIHRECGVHSHGHSADE